MGNVNIKKGTTGANASTNEDNICGLLINAPEITADDTITGLEHGVVYPITNLKDAENMGVVAGFDTDNDVRLHRHIKEFYRMAGDGTKLFIMVCPEEKTMKEMFEEYSHSLIVGAEGNIKYLGVGFNPPAGYTPVYANGLETVVKEAIAVAQAVHDWSWETYRPCNLILEGRGINGAVASMLDLRNITIGSVKLEATNVSLCIGQDWDFAETLTGESQNFADIGTLLGTRAALPVNRNVGEVETMDISDAKKAVWLTAGLSNHSKISALDEDLAGFDAKGYIFGMSYTGVSGYRWNNDHTCTPEIVDDDGFMNESTIALGAVMGKAARELRKRLLPKLKSSVPVDSATGKLPVGIVKYFEGLGNKAFTAMLKAGEISDAKTVVDPTSNLMSGDKELKVSFTVVPTGTINAISGTLNLKTTF